MNGVLYLFCWLLVGGACQWLSVTHVWSSVDFDYPSPFMKRDFLAAKEHVPENIVMLDVDTYEGRIFVTTPSLIGGTPATLSTLAAKPDRDGFYRLKPFPSWLWHNVTDSTDCHSIKSVFRIKIDKLGRLWVVDSGVSFAFNDRKGRRNCNPKILIFDLNDRDKLIHSYEIDKLNLDEDSLLLNIEVQVMSADGKQTFAYIADSMGTRMVIYDYAKDKIHSYQHPYFFPDPAFGFFHVNGKEFTVMDGLFNIALDQNTDTLYFHTLASGRECSAPASLLRNTTMSEEQARKFKRYSERPFHVSSEVMTDEGLLIFPSLEHNSLFVWDTQTPHSLDNYMLVAKDNEALQFPTGMKISGNKFIMMTARLQNMLVTGTPNRGEINYRILQGDVNHLRSLYYRYSHKTRVKSPFSTFSGPTSYSYTKNLLFSQIYS